MTHSKIDLTAALFIAITISLSNANDTLPKVPDGFVVDIVAKEPMVSNPCVMAFDPLGRICVAQGPQWRGPNPETPGDRVDILIDRDGDGATDEIKTFADGFNSIQGIAWHGRDLWVANAPDLTVVRDTTGDDRADTYIRVYTGLGNLEHSLHGLNFGPDGLLYMSKGNSKGYNRLDQLAPKPFRELWGLPSPKGAADYTPLEFHTRNSYKRKYHTPQDDWGQQGGILRCRPYENSRVRNPKVFARDLEIVSRGFRNPWDICFDDRFNWLGTDNDQTQGDKIFAPFSGSHFGWGHPWSFHWTGDDHLPTVPASAPLFEGSGAGVIYYRAEQFPEQYRDLFFVNDWMRREVYAFRPKWDGALMKCVDGFPPVFAHADGGRSLPSSSGTVFEPTDLEVGPDGALYVLSWGHGYGGTMKNNKQVDAGRVYRIRYAGNSLVKWRALDRQKPLADFSLQQLFADLACDIPAWRVNSQNELLRREEQAKIFLLQKLKQKNLTTAEQTWTMWTLGRMIDSLDLDQFFLKQLTGEQTRNVRIQAIRILAFRSRQFKTRSIGLQQGLTELLGDKDTRVRHAAVQAIWQAQLTGACHELVNLAATEQDRIVYYSTWNALRNLASLQKRKHWLEDPRAGVRLAVLLGLFHDDLISAKEALVFRNDKEQRIVDLTNDWLRKTGKAQPIVQFTPPAGEYSNSVEVRVKSLVPNSSLTYTTDGSLPSFTSPRVTGPIRLNRSATLRVLVKQGSAGAGQIVASKYNVRYQKPYRHREFVRNVRTPSGKPYRMDWIGLEVGKRHYTDRSYSITQIPSELNKLPFLQAANGDDRSSGNSWLTFETSEPCDIIVGVDRRNPAPLQWMKIGQPDGFQDMKLELSTTDPVFRLFRKTFPAGKVVLGGNTNHPRTDTGRGNYLVVFNRPILPPLSEREVTMEEVFAKLPTADPTRGREIFLHPNGAGCFKCHRMETIGGVFAPDLSDIGSRTKDPRVLIESILQPSKVITEGFAQQIIGTVDGKIHSGAVVEETSQMIRLVNSEAAIKVINKADIEQRRGSRLSPMPSGLGKTMNAQQVADLTVWLMAQKSVGNKDGFWFKESDEHLAIYFKQARISTYLKKHETLTRRALVNVSTPTGIQVTRNFPPRKPEDVDPGYTAEDGIIHPHMHPGIWLGFGDVDGNDYWRLKAKVKFDGFIKKPTGAKMQASFTARNLFMSEDGKRVVCVELTRYQFTRVRNGLRLNIEAEYKSDQKDFYFGDQEESGLAVRVASPIRVSGGNGTILNNRGEKNGQEVWGKPAKWFDYFGTIQDRRVGVMVVPAPSNPRPSWLHARDYGVIVTNPFPKQPKERREPYVKTTIKKGEAFKLAYAMLIYDQPSNEKFDHTAAAKELIKSIR